MCWIEQVINYHPTGTLRFQVHDFGRHPTVKDDGKELGPDDWCTVAPGKTVNLENCGVPWGGNQQALRVEADVDGKKGTVQFDIVNQDAWDFIRIRDEEYREHGRAEVGSLGNAPGINHSAWRLVLHSDGKVDLHCEWRQGLTREGAKELGAVALEIGGMAVSLGGSGIGLAGSLGAAVIAL
jgi:hypothetical protein